MEAQDGLILGVACVLADCHGLGKDLEGSGSCSTQTYFSNS